MIKFSDRLKLIGLYQRWLYDSNIELNKETVQHIHPIIIQDCPESFIVFLLQKGFLNESAIKNAIKRIHETHIEENW